MVDALAGSRAAAPRLQHVVNVVGLDDAECANRGERLAVGSVQVVITTAAAHPFPLIATGQVELPCERAAGVVVPRVVSVTTRPASPVTVCGCRGISTVLPARIVSVHRSPPAPSIRGRSDGRNSSSVREECS